MGGCAEEYLHESHWLLEVQQEMLSASFRLNSLHFGYNGRLCSVSSTAKGEAGKVKDLIRKILPFLLVEIGSLKNAFFMANMKIDQLEALLTHDESRPELSEMDLLGCYLRCIPLQQLTNKDGLTQHRQPFWKRQTSYIMVAELTADVKRHNDALTSRRPPKLFTRSECKRDRLASVFVGHQLSLHKYCFIRRDYSKDELVQNRNLG